MKERMYRALELIRAPRPRLTIQVLLVVFVLFFFVRAVANLAPEIGSHNWQFYPGYVALAGVLIALRGPLPVLGWRAILRKLGYTLGFLKATKYVYYSAIAGFVPGSVWHAVSRVYLVERAGIPRGVAGLSMLLESLVVLNAAVLISGLSLLAWTDVPAWLIIVAVALLALLILRPALTVTLTNFGLRLLGRQPFEGRVSTVDMILFLIPYTASWLLYGITCWTLLAAVWPGTTVLQIAPVAGFFTLAWVGGYLAILVPQGLVVRELLVVSLLTSGLGVSAPDAAAAALLSRAASLVGTAVWGLVATRL